MEVSPYKDEVAAGEATLAKDQKDVHHVLATPAHGVLPDAAKGELPREGAIPREELLLAL